MAVVQLPYQFILERYLTKKHGRSLFVQQASPFQDFVVRCVRYAFARIPAKIVRVFFSKAVMLPFYRFRMLRYGFLQSPIRWHEIKLVSTMMRGLFVLGGVEYSLTNVEGDTIGLWITPDELQIPDIVIYYCHGMLKSHCFMS